MSRRKLVLEEMGIAPLWRLREQPGSAQAQGDASAGATSFPGAAGEHAPDSAPGVQNEQDWRMDRRQADNAQTAPVGRVSAEAQGVERSGFEAKGPEARGVLAARAAGEERPAPPAVPPADANDAQARREQILRMDWTPLKAEVARCVACPLHRTRTRTVFGVGDENADWMFVGEGPGADEDAQGEPFVGQAGRLLDSMLAAIELKRGNGVYIANVVKCRPPNNRNPQESEMSCCEPYLARQIELIQPKLIVSLGRVSANHLLQVDASIASLRGRVHRYRGTPLIVTYHPAYLLRSLQEKAKAWVDLCFARETMESIRSGRSVSP